MVQKIYEFSQNAIWRGQKLSASPIKFSYWLAAEIPQSCTIEKNDKKTFSKACTDLNDTIGDEYKCGDTTFDLIKGVGEAKYNPYCYKSCKTTINSENIGSVQGTYKAGMGFDWNFLLGYTKDCSVNILLDKYPSSPSLTDERNLEICYNSIEAGAGDITANIENFRYGNRNFSNLVLNPPPATSIESSTTAKYYNASGTEISVTDPNKATPSELRSKDVSKIQYHYEKPKVAYSTDEFGCVLKSNGLAVRCDTLNDNLEHVLNNTTYPIAFTQHPVLNMPITLNINLGGEKIQRTCHYNITNEIFGKEDEDTPVNCNTTDNCEDLTSTGIDIIYRPISLNNPFPGINGGVNWENNNTNSFGKNWTSDNVDDFILQNRNVENNAVYLLDPLYHLELNLGQIRQIRNYNNEHNYNDFTFNCEEGLECVARENNILRNLDTYAGTCSNVLRSENGQYYTCANKEIPDESEVP